VFQDLYDRGGCARVAHLLELLLGLGCALLLVVQAGAGALQLLAQEASLRTLRVQHIRALLQLRLQNRRLPGHGAARSLQLPLQGRHLILGTIFASHACCHLD
jgi:hypothetical protein